MEGAPRGLGQVLVDDRVVDHGRVSGPRRPELVPATRPRGRPGPRVLAPAAAISRAPRSRAKRGLWSAQTEDRRASRPSSVAMSTGRRSQPARSATRRCGGQGRRLEPEALQVHRAALRPPRCAAAAEAEVVEAQVQARAGPDLQQAQGKAGARGLEEPEGEGGAAADLVRLAGEGDQGPQLVGPGGDEVAKGLPGRPGVVVGVPARGDVLAGLARRPGALSVAALSRTLGRNPAHSGARP